MLPGIRGLFAMWCRAVAPIGLFPDQLRRHRVWELAVLLSDDTAGPGPVFAMPRGEPQAPGDRPAPRMEAD